MGFSKTVILCGMFASHAAEMANFHQMISCNADDLERIWDSAVELDNAIIRNNVGDVYHVTEMLQCGHGMCCFRRTVIICYIKNVLNLIFENL